MEKANNSEFDKGIVFDYLTQLRNEYVKILQEYRLNEIIPFRELIISEIFTEASSLLLSFDNSSFSNIETAKRLTKKTTIEFFEKKNLNRVLEKYWRNNGKCGLVSISTTQENLNKFVCATDITSDKTKTLINLLLNKVNDFSPRHNICNRKNAETSKLNHMPVNRFWRIFAIVAIIAFCFIGYLNAAKNRYRSFNEGYFILDSWTGKVYDIEDRYASPQ